MVGHDGAHSFHANVPAQHNPVLAWKVNWAGSQVTPPVVGRDGTIYVGVARSSGSQIVAVDPRGTIRWSVPVQGAPSAAAIATDSNLYFGTNAGLVYSVTPSGVIRWTTSIADGVTHRLHAGHASVGCSGMVLAVMGSSVTGVDSRVSAVTTNGTALWSYDVSDDLPFPPVVSPLGTLYVGCSSVWALTPAGALSWSSRPLRGDDSVYSIDVDGTLYNVFGARTPVGAAMWTRVPDIRADNNGGTALTATGDILFGEAPNLTRTRPNGATVWRFHATGWPQVLTYFTMSHVLVDASDQAIFVIDAQGTGWGETTPTPISRLIGVDRFGAQLWARDLPATYCVVQGLEVALGLEGALYTNCGDSLFSFSASP